MNGYVVGVKDSQEKEGFASCQSPKGEDRKEPQFDILLREQGGAKSLINKRSHNIVILVLKTKKETKNEKFKF